MYLKEICIFLRELIKCLRLLVCPGSPPHTVCLSATMPMTNTGWISFFPNSARPFHISVLCYNLLLPPGILFPTKIYQWIGPQTSRSKSTLRSRSWWQWVPPCSSSHSILASSLLEGMVWPRLIYLSLFYMRQKVAGNAEWMNEWMNEVINR